MTWCAYKSSLSASLKVQSFANDGCVSCITSMSHRTPSDSLLLSESYLQEHTVQYTFSCYLSICPVSPLSLLFSPCIKGLLRTLAWGGCEQWWTLHLQKHAAVRDVQPYAVMCCLSELADITMSSSECCSYVSCKYIVSRSLFFLTHLTLSSVFHLSSPPSSYLKGTIFYKFINDYFQYNFPPSLWTLGLFY